MVFFSTIDVFGLEEEEQEAEMLHFTKICLTFLINLILIILSYYMYFIFIFALFDWWRKRRK